MNQLQTALTRGCDFTVLILLALAVSGCGTPWLKQGSNQFSSNTYIGWVPAPTGKPPTYAGDHEQFVRVQPVIGSYATDEIVEKDDCFAVDYAGSFLHDSFEGTVEKAWASILGPVRSEMSVVLKVEHRIPPATQPAPRDFKEDATFAFNNAGQLKMRHVSGQTYEQLLGPTRYRGGEVQLTAVISEQDIEEYKEMVNETIKVANQVKSVAPSGKKSDVVALVAAQSTISDISKLTIAPYGYVAVAAEAVAMSAKILEVVNADNDAIMRESITLMSAKDVSGKPKVRRPLLRYGTYVFVRSSVDQGPIQQDACVRYSGSARFASARFSRCDSAEGWNAVTSLAFVVRPVADEFCPAKGVIAPAQPASATGVTDATGR